jgi:REP element-mobilizing transposase RayT
MEQTSLQLDRKRRSRRGGKRENAGRKPVGAEAGRPHVRRQRIERRLPVHVTVRMARHVYNLRSRRSFSIIGRALAIAADRFGVRIVEFSVQGNHMHLVVEAAAHEALSRAMQGFSIRVAKGLNAMMKRSGRVFADRYHAHILETPDETRWAVLYVRRNYQKHMREIGKPVSPDFVDPFASPGANIELAEPRTWLLRCAAGPHDF